MSDLAVRWALDDSPVTNTHDRLILIALARHARDDGTNAFPSVTSIARSALCDRSTVLRKLQELRARKIITKGDQDAARYLDPRRRPVVYDLMIPASWYSSVQLDGINDERVRIGLSRITPDNRPDLKNPGVSLRDVSEQDVSEQGVSEKDPKPDLRFSGVSLRDVSERDTNLSVSPRTEGGEADLRARRPETEGRTERSVHADARPDAKEEKTPPPRDEDRVLRAWVNARRASGWRTMPRQRAAFTEDVRMLLEDGDTVDFLIEAAEDMGRAKESYMTLSVHLPHYDKVHGSPDSMPVPDENEALLAEREMQVAQIVACLECDDMGWVPGGSWHGHGRRDLVVDLRAAGLL